jgi:hypothetical protein
VLATPGGGAAPRHGVGASGPPPLSLHSHARPRFADWSTARSPRRAARRRRPARGAFPRCGRSPGRAGVRPVGSFARTLLQKQVHGSRPAQHRTVGDEARLHAQLTGRRGHGHGAHGCGRPAPAPTSTCTAHPRHEGRVHSSSRHGAKGTLHIRAGGASRARRGARRRGATRGDPPAHLQRRQESPQKRRQLWDITAWGSQDPRLPLHSATRRDAASPMGRRRRARTNRGGSKARSQAARLRRPAQGEEKGDHGAHRGSTVKAKQSWRGW